MQAAGACAGIAPSVPACSTQGAHPHGQGVPSEPWRQSFLYLVYTRAPGAGQWLVLVPTDTVGPELAWPPGLWC